MATTDILGLALSGANADSVHHYEQALHQLPCYIGDPVATIEAALAGRPEFAMGHALHAWLQLLGNEPAARQDLARLAALPERWLPFADTAHYAFNDAHAMMAFVADGRGDNAGFTREVGAPLAQAIQAFGAGVWGRTVALLRPCCGAIHKTYR